MFLNNPKITLLKPEMRALFPEITSGSKALTSHYYATRFIVYYPVTNQVTTRILYGSTGDNCARRFSAHSLS
jgi:hypothetical protein